MRDDPIREIDMDFEWRTRRAGSQFADSPAGTRGNPGRGIAAKAGIALGPTTSEYLHRVLNGARRQGEGEPINAEGEG